MRNVVHDGFAFFLFRLPFQLPFFKVMCNLIHAHVYLFHVHVYHLPLQMHADSIYMLGSAPDVSMCNPLLLSCCWYSYQGTCSFYCCRFRENGHVFEDDNIIVNERKKSKDQDR